MNPVAPLMITGIASIPIMGLAGGPNSPSGPLEFGVYVAMIVCMALAVRVLYNSNQEKDKQIIELVRASITAQKENSAAMRENSKNIDRVIGYSNEILSEVRKINEDYNV